MHFTVNNERFPVKSSSQYLGLLSLGCFLAGVPVMGQAANGNSTSGPATAPVAPTHVNGNGLPAPQGGNSSTSNYGPNGVQTGTVTQQPQSPPVMNGAPPTPTPATPPAPAAPAAPAPLQ
jgi:hypothetical protein